MCNLSEGIYERGIRYGEKRGIAMCEKRGGARGEERMAGLMKVLYKEGHDEAVFRAINDSAYRNELYKKYKL